MKHSTVAVALLSASLGAVVNGQHLPSGRVKTISKTIRGSSSQLLTADVPGEAELLATCQALTASGGCNSNESCTWCVSGAVPSACYPVEMSSRLPEGVFDCGAKQEEAAFKGGSFAEAIALQTFNLKEGVTLTLETAEVDKDFCDASSPLSLAGYMNVKGSQFDRKNDKNLFYWFFEKRTTSQLPAGSPKLQAGEPTSPEETPFIVWLTGGPGCSSSLALLTENGPCSVESDSTSTKVNPYSWTETANVLWLDQPADVGYSYGEGNDSDEEMISEDAYYFLQAFFKSEEGRKYKDSPLFIVGESYGGHYAPAIAHRIWMGNKNLQGELSALKLKGLAVGNGWTDPEEQFKWYAEMAYKNEKGIKAVDGHTYSKMTRAIPKCTEDIRKCNNNGNSFDCQMAFVSCNSELEQPYSLSKLNPYDMTKECGSNPLCYDFSPVENFMNLASTKQALHVDNHNPSWQTCNMNVNTKFHVDGLKSFAPYVADMLNDGIPALIYAGDLDFICNYMGNRAWTLNLAWDHNSEFKAAEEHDWNDGAGLARTSNGLTFLRVYDAGHMVPSDQPEVSLQMITQFLNGQTF